VNAVSPPGRVSGPVFITGAASGIGLAVARLAARGSDAVAMLDIDPEVQGSAVALARDTGARVVAVVCDVADEADVTRAFEVAAHQVGEPVGLVTCAGIDRGGPVHELSAAAWDQVLGVNLRGTFLACRSALRYMLPAGEGSIVCIASPFALVAPPQGGAAYCASKGGVCALVRALAVDYGTRGVRANALLPGPTETPLMWANVPPDRTNSVRAAVRTEVAMGRLAEPEEPARAALWLLSRDASYVTGAALACDGGVLAKASVSV
jgi:NAD(P)-dependent dehydrogenase (short-subunit alcohol dehydrogenase family)